MSRKDGINFADMSTSLLSNNLRRNGQIQIISSVEIYIVQMRELE